jgi:hypothetical protein
LSENSYNLAQSSLKDVCIVVGAFYVYYFILQSERSPIDLLMNNPVDGPQYEARLYGFYAAMFERFFPLMLIAFFALSFTRAAITFVKSSEYGKSGIVPPKDLPIIAEAIKNGRPEHVDQYIRLASLTGGVGLFQKIGLTGLPLTTLALVVFFAVGVIFADDKSETFKAFLDFTKLTLGAFIGSFVQRQVERRGQESDLQKAISSAQQGSASTRQSLETK